MDAEVGRDDWTRISSRMKKLENRLMPGKKEENQIRRKVCDIIVSNFFQPESSQTLMITFFIGELGSLSNIPLMSM